MWIKNLRRPWLLAVIGAGALALVGAAGAAFPDNDVKLYTGCLTAGGTIVNVKEGASPLQACASPKQVVKLSGGDITSLTVSAPLTGGGSNGALQIGLDSAFKLPAGCTGGQVPKWNGTTGSWVCGTDSNTTYAAGTGLDLASGTFSVEPGYRLPQSCAENQLVQRGASGWQCASQSTGVIASQTQVGTLGLPDDDAPRDVVTLTVGAGTWAVFAKAVLEDSVDDRGFQATNGDGCAIVSGATVLDTAAVTLADSNDGRGAIDFPMAMVGSVVGPATIKLQCRAQEDADLVAVSQGKVLAIKVS